MTFDRIGLFEFFAEAFSVVKVRIDGRGVIAEFRRFSQAGDFRDQEGLVLDAAAEALAAQDTDLDFDLVQPTGVSWRVVEPELLEDAVRLRAGKAS